MKQIESIAQELQLAKEYWLRTVQPHIVGRKLRDVELFVAEDAHRRLCGAQRKAEDWYRTQEGRLSPLDVNLSEEKFREPEILFADENLKPAILAEIAAPMMNKDEGKMTPAEAVRNAHELLMAAERYIGTLPEKKEGIESVVCDMKLELSHHVSFAEILRSNEKDSRQLRLLPPVPQNRNAGKLSLAALRNAVKNFLEQKKKDRPPITEEQWNRETEQDMRLGLTGSKKPQTYQEWQSEPDEEIRDCLQNGWILLQTLCTLRWERFKSYWQDQWSRTQTRKPSESKRPKKGESKTNLPRSAASSPATSGKRKQ